MKNKKFIINDSDYNFCLSRSEIVQLIINELFISKDKLKKAIKDEKIGLDLKYNPTYEADKQVARKMILQKILRKSLRKKIYNQINK